MKILLAVDGSEFSNAAVDEIAFRPWPEGSEVKIVSAIEMPFAPTPEIWALPESYYGQLEQSSREHAESAVRSAAEKIRAAAGDGAPNIKTEVAIGRAEDVILQTAEVWGADLILVGSHGYRAWQRFLLGSVSSAIATHAHCSVEIVRHRQAKQVSQARGAAQ